jgi:hypothetical protein
MAPVPPKGLLSQLTEEGHKRPSPEETDVRQLGGGAPEAHKPETKKVKKEKHRKQKVEPANKQTEEIDRLKQQNERLRSCADSAVTFAERFRNMFNDPHRPPMDVLNDLMYEEQVVDPDQMDDVFGPKPEDVFAGTDRWHDRVKVLRAQYREAAAPSAYSKAVAAKPYGSFAPAGAPKAPYRSEAPAGAAPLPYHDTASKCQI